MDYIQSMGWQSPWDMTEQLTLGEEDCGGMDKVSRNLVV